MKNLVTKAVPYLLVLAMVILLVRSHVGCRQVE